MIIEPKSKRLETLATAWHHYAGKPHFVEPVGPDEESVWEYPRPPSIQKVTRNFEIFYKGEKILRSASALKVCEQASPPSYYFDPKDFHVSLIRTDQESECEWKGTATYWDLKLETETLLNMAWSYETPFLEYTALKGLIALYPHPLECYINSEKVKPQPGRFYGGWVTKDIKGPFKGSPGSSNW